jgi:hypothetical protein
LGTRVPLEKGGLPFPAPLALVDLGPQRRIAGGQLGHLALPRTQQGQQVLSTP